MIINQVISQEIIDRIISSIPWLEIITVVAILVATWILVKIFNLIIDSLLRFTYQIVRVHIKRIFSVLIWSLGIIFAIQQLGLRIDLLIAIIILIGIGAIIASREILENLASKYFVDIYIPFKVGDKVTIKGYSGKVIEINPIATILLSDNDEIIAIPNSLFLKEITANVTPNVWKEVIIPIKISSTIKLEEFEKELLKACNKYKHLLDTRFPPIVSIKNIDSKSTELTLTLMANDVEKKTYLMNEINAKIAELINKFEKPSKAK
jgi:small conductance mechanosensitive channel